MKYFALPAVLIFCSSLGSIEARATPKEVLVIRHAEKPAHDETNHLSAKGYERARALLTVFGPGNGRFEVPDIILAQAPAESSGSVRAIETVQPLADSLSLRVNTSFKVKNNKQLVDYVLNSPECDGKVVLIAWGQDEIPKIAAKLGAENLPQNWKGETYDRVWRIDLSREHIRGENLPMRALRGDSNK